MILVATATRFVACEQGEGRGGEGRERGKGEKEKMHSPSRFFNNITNLRAVHRLRDLKTSEIPLFTFNNLQNFKQIKQITFEILHIDVFQCLPGLR